MFVCKNKKNVHEKDKLEHLRFVDVDMLNK